METIFKKRGISIAPTAIAWLASVAFRPEETGPGSHEQPAGPRTGVWRFLMIVSR